MTQEELISYLQRVAAKEDTLRPLLGTLKALNPGAVVSGAAMSSVMSLPDFEHETAAPLPEPPEDATAPITATTIDIEETIGWAAFSVWLSALLYARGDDIAQPAELETKTRGRTYERIRSGYSRRRTRRGGLRYPGRPHRLRCREAGRRNAPDRCCRVIGGARLYR